MEEHGVGSGCGGRGLAVVGLVVGMLFTSILEVGGVELVRVVMGA